MSEPDHPAALPPEALCAPISAADFDFATTETLEPLGDWLGQDRGIGVMRMAAAMEQGDFNAFVMGNPGSGRHRIARAILSDAASRRPCPDDWVYVNNFETPHKPVAIALPPGDAERFRKAMEGLIDDLASDIPALFESEDYQTRRRAIEEGFASAHEAAMSAVFEEARARKVAILRTPMGFTFAGLDGDEAMTKERYEALPEKDREALDTAMEETQEKLSEVLRALPKQQKAHRREVEELNSGLARQGVDAAIAEVREAFAGQEAVLDHLDRVRDHLIENADIFLQRPEGEKAGPFPPAATRQANLAEFQPYAVNVMVSNCVEERAAPVVVEDLPTLENLIGRIEYASQMGTLVTNFTKIKPGALHRANGGYLVLDALRVLSEPMAWDGLKRCLRTGEIPIYSAGERLGLISTVSLTPDPVPLKVRVILIGERKHYYLLSALDPDFPQLFKLEADFDDHLALADDSRAGYARLISGLASRVGTRPLEAGAVAGLIRESLRATGDAERLTLNTGFLTDFIHEADFWAGERKAPHIAAADIDTVAAARERRAGRLRELSQEAITRGTMLIDTEGTRTGQINALSVLRLGGHMFGRPSRLTARVRPGTGKLVDIERETELGGPIHSKGMLILQGYLAATYATTAPMSLWASLVFEQSYGGVDGDSASAAELIALLSALAEAPIDQSLAITGSVNQFGDIQAIGGVNEKIEGFFDICAARGLTGSQGVLIPAANVKNLCLRQRVIDAVAEGRFRIVPMAAVADGLAALTGMTPGKRGADGSFAEGSLNARVEARLTEFADIRRRFAREARNGSAEQS